MGIIARQSIKGTIVTYLGVAMGFFTTFFVLTRFLTAEEIGLTRVLIDAAMLFVSLAQLGTASSTIRFYPFFRQNDSHTPTPNAQASTLPNQNNQATAQNLPLSSSDARAHGFFFWTLLIPLLGFLIFALLYFLCSAPLQSWFGEKSPLFVDYYYFVLPLSFFLLYQTIFETNANVLMRIVVPRLVREVVVRIGMLLLYLLYAFRLLSLDGFVFAICLNYALCALINLFYLIRIGHISFRPDFAFLRANRPLVASVVKYSSFVFVSALAAALGPTISSFFISAKMGLDYTGIYAIASYIAVMVSIPYRSLTAIASPQLARATKDNDRTQAQSLIHQVANNLLLVGGFIFFLIWCNIDLIFHLLPNGSTYQVATLVVFLLSLTQLLIATCQIAITTISFSRYYAFTLLFSFLLTLSSLYLNNTLIPILGINGAALSTLLSNFLYFAAALLVLRFSCHLRLLNRRSLFILLLLLALFAINALIVYLFPNLNIYLSALLRTLIIAPFGLLLAYRFALSPEINSYLSSLLSRFKH